jgi:phage terminase large subunit-like protein
VLIPKKNAKTVSGAGIMMTALVLNQRPAAELILLGPTKEVASNSYDKCVGMIEADEEGFLKKRFHTKDHQKTIIDRRNKASLKIKSFDTKVVTGGNSIGILVDELHEISNSHSASNVILQLRGGMIAQPEAFLIFITTQSVAPPKGAFDAELKKARGIRDGTITGVPMLPLLYEFPREIVKSGEWRDPKIWHWVNPNTGKSLKVQRLVEEYHAKETAGEGSIREWASQFLNLEIGLAFADSQWEGLRFWAKCADPALTLDDLLARSEVIQCGIDGGGLDDLLGFCVIGREKGTRKWLVWAHAWCHRSVLEIRTDIAANLLDFERDGDLTIIDKAGDDVKDIADYIEWFESLGLLPEKYAIGVDPVGISDILDELALRGFDVNPEVHWIEGIKQGYELNGMIKTLARRVEQGDVRHCGRPMLNWCLSNVKVEPRGNAVTITKQVAGKAKIDPFMAMLDAAALMARNPEAARSIYEERGLLIV